MRAFLQVSKSKPDPQIFRHAASLFDGAPAADQILVFEDVTHRRLKCTSTAPRPPMPSFEGCSKRSRSRPRCRDAGARADCSLQAAWLKFASQVCHVPDVNLSRDLCGQAHCELLSLEDISLQRQSKRKTVQHHEDFRPEEWGLPAF